MKPELGLGYVSAEPVIDQATQAMKNCRKSDTCTSVDVRSLHVVQYLLKGDAAAMLGVLRRLSPAAVQNLFGSDD